MTDVQSQLSDKGVKLDRYSFLTPNGIISGFWAVPRPKTHRWGSGLILDRMIKQFGKPDIAFGKTDQIPDDIITVDINPDSKPTFLLDWKKLPFNNNEFNFGYWDPPYDKLYKKEGQEIWRTCKKLAILHTHCYPTAWLKNAKRTVMIAVSLGPMKQMRVLQIFEKELHIISSNVDTPE